MRKTALLLVILAALAGAAGASAAKAPPPNILCGPTCDPGGGWTGCASASAGHSADVGVASIHHYLIVDYCKVGGVITSLSIAAHVCDVNGLISCNVGPAWQSGGGVGSSWATFEAHATWSTFPYFFNNTDSFTLTVPSG